MKYLSRKKRKIIRKIVRKDEGDGYRDPYKIADDRLGKKLTKLSQGGKIERSHKKKVGNIANMNLDKKYILNNAVAETMKRIEDIYSRKKRK